MPDSLTRESLSRVCTVDDLPWMLSLAYRRYTPRFDPGSVLLWLARVLKAPEALALRNDHALVIATIAAQPWWPDQPECTLSALVAEKGHHWDAIRLLRDSIAWARGKGCARWLLWSETDYDFSALARRVGAMPRMTKYELDLRE